MVFVAIACTCFVAVGAPAHVTPTELIPQLAAGAGAGPTFVPMAPARLADTRGEATVDGGGPRGAVGAGDSIDVQITGRAGIPTSGVGAVALNLTSAAASEPSFLTVWPAGEARPLASNLNPVGPDPLANTVIVKLGATGAISVFNAAGSVHVILDVTGWFPPDGGFVPVSPARLADTRLDQPTVDGSGPRGRVGPGETITVAAAGRGGVPAGGAAAVALTVTAVGTSELSFLTVWPSGQPQPLASNLNPAGPLPLAAHVVARLGDDGAVSLFNAAGSTDLIVDVAGWFTVDSSYLPISPQRLVDTRELAFDQTLPPRPLLAGGEGRIRVAGRAGLPSSGVGAVVLNVTAISLHGPTYLTVWPTGTPRPWASNLNPPPGPPIANLVVAKVGFGGEVSIYTDSSATHVMVDIAGWFPSSGNAIEQAGPLELGVSTQMPGLLTDEAIRYPLAIPHAGFAFSVIAAPNVDGLGRRCGTLQVRRPDLSLAGEARTGCATTLDPTLDIDLTANTGGTWYVDFTNTEFDRHFFAGFVIATPTLSGALAMNAPTPTPSLLPGQNARYSFAPTAGAPVGATYTLPADFQGDSCAVTLTMRRPDGTVAATTSATTQQCFSGHTLAVQTIAAVAGTWVLEVDNGGIRDRAASQVQVAHPLPMGSITASQSVSVPVVTSGQTLQWTTALSAGQNVRLFTDVFIAPISGGCLSFSVLRPNGTAAAGASRCQVFTPTLLDVVADATGTWTVVMTSSVPYPLGPFSFDLSKDLVEPADRAGVSAAVPALLGGQGYRRTMTLSVGERLNATVQPTPGIGCDLTLRVLRPDGSDALTPAGLVCGISSTSTVADQAGTWTVLLQGSARVPAGYTLIMTLPLAPVPLSLGVAAALPALRPGEEARYQVSLTNGQFYSFPVVLNAAQSFVVAIERPDGTEVAPAPYQVVLPADATGNWSVRVNAPEGAPPAAGSIRMAEAVDGGTLSFGVPSTAGTLAEGDVVFWRLPASSSFSTVHASSSFYVRAADGTFTPDYPFPGSQWVGPTSAGTWRVEANSSMSGHSVVARQVLTPAPALQPTLPLLQPGQGATVQPPNGFVGSVETVGPETVQFAMRAPGDTFAQAFLFSGTAALPPGFVVDVFNWGATSSTATVRFLPD